MDVFLDDVTFKIVYLFTTTKHKVCIGEAICSGLQDRNGKIQEWQWYENSV